MIETSIRRLKWLLAAEAVEKSFLEFVRVVKFDPSQPRVAAGNTDGGQWTSANGLGGQRIAARRLSPAAEAECEQLRLRDEFQCRMIGLRACWAQAALRYANCLADLPIPPLNY